MKARLWIIVSISICILVRVLFWSRFMDPSSANFSKNTTRLSINNLSVLKDHITVYSASKHNSTAAICLLVRNETLYIDEFMDFHISLGFKVYLYDNSANSVTDDLDLHLWYSKRKDIQKYVKIIHFPQAPAQVAAYLQCLKHDAANETFVAMIDIDEFVVLKKHDNIIDFMEEHCSEDCGQISLNWNMMTVSNETDYRPVPTLMRNIHSDHIWGTIKVIVRPSYVDTDRFNWWHSVRLKKGNWVDTTGKVIQRPNDGRNRRINNDAPSDVALLHHYRFRSPGEFYQKSCVRGDVLQSRGKYPKCIINKTGTQVDQGMYGGNLDTLAWEQLKKMVPKYAIFENNTNATINTLYPDYPYRF